VARMTSRVRPKKEPAFGGCVTVRAFSTGLEGRNRGEGGESGTNFYWYPYSTGCEAQVDIQRCPHSPRFLRK
jgi:hypothetical protein